MLAMGILCCIDSYKTYFSRSVKVIKNSKRLIFSGSLLLVLNIYLTLALFSDIGTLYYMGLKITLLDFLKTVIIMPLFIPGIVILSIGLFNLKYSKLEYKEEINIERQRNLTRKLKWLIVVITILLTWFIAPKFYSAIKNETNDKIDVINEKVEENIDNVADWETYRNFACAFRIQYPKS